jgi:hypothetical protein
MYIVILNIFNISSVSMMSKTTESCPIKICCQGWIWSNKAIDSHIKFLSSNQKRINNISLDNVRFSLRTFRLPSEIIFPLSNLLELIKQENTFALRFCNRLHNPDTTHILLEFFHKQWIISRKIVCCWEKVISISK